MKDYKEEIQKTRLGCLGGSDAAMLARISNLGYVPLSARKRLAVCKGLIPQEEIPHTAAMRAGDEMENAIYEHLAQNDNTYESNPFWVSEKYSKSNVKLIDHPDIVRFDKEKKCLYVYEVKTTKLSVEETKREYRPQLYIHSLLAREMANAQIDGRKWRVKLFLVHYDTKGLDLAEGIEFDPSRMSVAPIAFRTEVFNVKEAMNLVSDFLKDYDVYSEDGVVDYGYLPDNVKEKFDAIACTLREIKEREEKVEDFKNKLYTFLVEKNIKSIKNDEFSIVRVDESESKSFDGKKYIEELKSQHPVVAKRIIAKYTKVIKRKGNVQIRLKNKES